MSIASLLTNNNKEYLQLKVHSLDVDANNDIEAELIKTNNIQELTVGNGVRFPDTIRCDAITDTGTDLHVNIRQVQANDPLEEFNSYATQITSSGTETKLINWTQNNAGNVASGYVNNVDLVNGLFTVQESGFYVTSIHVKWNAVNTAAGETFYFRCKNNVSALRDGCEIQLVPQNYTGVGIPPEASASQLAYLAQGDVLELRHFRFGGTSATVWDVDLAVYRLK